LRFERRLAHPPEQVWRAITEPDQLSRWFPQNIEYEGERAAGGRLHFSWRGEDEPPFGGEITAFNPPWLFEYTWDDEVLRWEIQSRDAGEGGCVLVFTDTMDDRTRAAKNASGWHACLDALGASLDGRSLARSSEERATALREGYVKSFV
jgi:uncharacterized protein YndB with AHSA1/START domain